MDTTIDEAPEAAEAQAAARTLLGYHSTLRNRSTEANDATAGAGVSDADHWRESAADHGGAVDTFMVARLGQPAVAGVGTAFEIVFFIISILSAIDGGATVLVSRRRSAPPTSEANQLAASDRLGPGAGHPGVVGIYLAAPLIIALFGTEPDVAVAAVTFCRSLRPSVALFLSFVCGAVLRGAGDSRTPLAAVSLATSSMSRGLYVDIQELRLPALGGAGSALGAAVGRGAGAAYMLVAMARGKKAISLRGSWGWRPHISSARQLFALGLPAAVEQMLSSGAFMVLLAVVALIGTRRSPRSRSPSLRCRRRSCPGSLSRLPQPRWSVRASERVFRTTHERHGRSRCAGRWPGSASAVCSCTSSANSSWGSSRPIRKSSRRVGALQALSFALPFWAVWFVSSGSLRGSGDTRTPLIVGASTMWLSVLLAWIGVRWFDAGMGWVWTGFVLTSAPASILVWRIFRQRISD